MTGEELRQRREAARLSRRQLSDGTGLKATRIEDYERGWKIPTEEDLATLEEFFGRFAAVTPEAEDGEEAPAVGGTWSVGQRAAAAARLRSSTGAVITPHWNGLDPGDIVTLAGDGGEQFRFGHHVFRPAQEYVTIYSLENGSERSVPIDRVRTSGGLPLPDVLSPEVPDGGI